MKYLNSYVDLMLQNIWYILFLYLILIIIQIICLYYEYNEKIYFIFGNKGLLFCSILISYIFKDNAMMLFIYIIGLVLLTNFVDKKYDEECSNEMSELFLEDIFFIFISGLISFYII